MLVVACPPAVVASKVGSKHPMPLFPNYITKEQPEEPAFQRKPKRVAALAFNQKDILTAVKITECKLNPEKLAQQIFPKQLICGLAGAVMDKNGAILEYRHLMK